jgi:hypothetical protein
MERVYVLHGLFIHVSWSSARELRASGDTRCRNWPVERQVGPE